MIPAIVSLGLLGLISAALLSYAAQKFAVERDPRVEAIIGVLPRAQCGACGYAGCAGLAEAIVKGKAPVGGCVVGGASVAAAVARILGVDVGEVGQRKLAVVHCGGGAGKVSARHSYEGLKTCRASVMPQLAGGVGHTLCRWGCLGYDDCAAACPFDALHTGPEGLPVVDAERCVGCGMCVAACPRGIIELRPASRRVHVLCKNRDRGASVRKYCRVGCIACRACARAVPEGYIVEDNLARVNYDQDLDVSPAIAKCPTKTIVDLDAAPSASESEAEPATPAAPAGPAAEG